MDVFERLESNVRAYSRSFPVVFERAKGSCLYDVHGKRYVDFLSGAGALNYGHNDEAMKRALEKYMSQDGIVHGLDLATSAKQQFLERFEAVVLRPRGMDFRIQFTGPTGTNAIESALKLARKVKQRSNIVAFTNSYHGLTAASLSVTADSYYRREAYVIRSNTSFLPYDGYFGASVNTIEYIARFITGPASGVDHPAAVIVETIQAEGGINVASAEWLRELARLCQDLDIILIVDDIQVGCGRAGTFFSFEQAGIRPDIVALSKSISGFGLPMSLVLIRPDLDQWDPGEHSGTFRGNNLAFVTADEALRFWESSEFATSIERKGHIIQETLLSLQSQYPQLDCRVRGRGMIHGFEVGGSAMAEAITREALTRGLMVERCGPERRVLKLLPPLVIEELLLAEGLQILSESILAALKRGGWPTVASSSGRNPGGSNSR